jgi:hypothetical protein
VQFTAAFNTLVPASPKITVATGVHVIVGVIAVFVTLNDALAEPVIVDTETLYEPLFRFAVNVPGSATPDPFVLNVIVPVLFEKLPVAPEPATLAVNVTDA